MKTHFTVSIPFYPKIYSFIHLFNQLNLVELDKLISKEQKKTEKKIILFVMSYTINYFKLNEIRLTVPIKSSIRPLFAIYINDSTIHSETVIVQLLSRIAIFYCLNTEKKLSQIK